MKSKKEITIYDIAEQLSISAATVSRALQNSAYVNEKTRQKVITTAKKLGYRYNTFARNLRMKSTNTIGFLVPKLNSNFINSVLAGVEKQRTTWLGKSWAEEYNLNQLSLINDIIKAKPKEHRISNLRQALKR